MLSLKISDTQKVFFTSDPHFAHRNICVGLTKWVQPPYTYETWPDASLRRQFCMDNAVRDFQDAETMTSAVIDEINRMVGPDDILFVLGDLYNGKIKKKDFTEAASTLDRINSDHMYVIWGNHDYEFGLASSDVIRKRFRGAGDLGSVTVRGWHFILSHYRISDWPRKIHGSVALHGHSHGMLPVLTGTHEGAERCMDAGLDAVYKATGELRPLSVEEIIQTMEATPAPKNKRDVNKEQPA